jgi:hypothetical protein
MKNNNEIEIHLPNGYVVEVFVHEGETIMGLVNPNGFYVSDTKLTETEKKTMETIFAEESK